MIRSFATMISGPMILLEFFRKFWIHFGALPIGWRHRGNGKTGWIVWTLEMEGAGDQGFRAKMQKQYEAKKNGMVVKLWHGTHIYLYLYSNLYYTCIYTRIYIYLIYTPFFSLAKLRDKFCNCANCGKQTTSGLGPTNSLRS